MTTFSEIDPDRLKGMFYGHVMGDVLGMPYERSRSKNMTYSPTIRTTTYHSKFQGTRTTGLGQPSDDTEMTLALFGSLVKNGISGDKNLSKRVAWNRDDVLLSYMEFANGCSFCGKNTRELFGGIKTVRTYEKRFDLKFSNCERPTESNGYLMRASPLVLLVDKNLSECTVASKDSDLTNPGLINGAYQFVYVALLRYLVSKNADTSITAIRTFLKLAFEEAGKHYEYSKNCTFDPNFNSIKGEIPDIRGEDKGWAKHALHCAIFAAQYGENYESCVQKIIEKGGDTDTNGCISGAVLGAKFGLSKMLESPIFSSNLEIIKRCTTENGDYLRNPKFAPPTYERLFQELGI